jgi:hypothetical protein
MIDDSGKSRAERRGIRFGVRFPRAVLFVRWLDDPRTIKRGRLLLTVVGISVSLFGIVAVAPYALSTALIIISLTTPLFEWISTLPAHVWMVLAALYLFSRVESLNHRVDVLTEEMRQLTDRRRSDP